MDNITVNGMKTTTNAFITLTDQGKILVRNSNFKGIYSYADGTVISGGASQTEAVVENSIFQENVAQKGGVFYLSDESFVKCTQCSIFNNFAITSGVVEVTLNGYFEFYESFLYNNYANSNPVSLVLDSASLSKINNCSIYGNEAFSRVQLAQEFLSCSKLCMINEQYKTYSNNNFGAIIVDNAGDQIFQVISGSLSIINSTRIYSQSVIMNAFVSTITFEDSLIENITFSRTSIQSVFSSLTLNRMVIRNLNNTANTDFILVMLDSSFVVSNLNYSSSNSILFRIRTSSIDIQTVNFDMIINATKLGEVADCYNTTINSMHTLNSLITEETLFTLESSNNMTLTNLHIFNSQAIALAISSSNISLISDVQIRNCSEGVKIQSSTVNLLENTVFDQNGKSQLLFGGAMKISDSSVNVRNSTFLRNTAFSGGALHFT